MCFVACLSCNNVCAFENSRDFLYERKMPQSTARNRVRVSGDAAIIEVSIPMRDACSTCHICANEFCDEETCCRTGIHLRCCTQTLCCKCMIRMCKKCRCTQTCDVVVAFCPYCRESVGVPVLDIFRGAIDECATCRHKNEGAADDEEEAEDQEMEERSSVGSSATTPPPRFASQWSTYFSSL